MRVFISHSSKNAGDAQKICTLIENNGYKCFLAPRDIRSGHEYAEEIINGIDTSEAMLLLLSQASNDSPHVLREIERAVSRNIPIIVYKLEEVKLSRSMEYFLMTHQWISSDANVAYNEIIRCIKDLDTDTKSSPASEEVPLNEPAKPTEKKTILPLILKIALPVAAGLIIGMICWLIISENQNNTSTSVPDSNSSDSIVSDDGDNNTDLSSVTDAFSASGNTSSITEATTSTYTEQESSSEPVSEPVIELPDVESSAPETSTTPATTTTTATSTTTTTSTAEVSIPEILAELGDTVILGTYNGKPIEWRIIKISDDGTQAMVISDKIITMKAFDAAEGGKFNFLDGEYYWNIPTKDLSSEQQMLLRGNNSWELSNLRTWLNSDKTNVTYKDQEPSVKAMSEMKNGYNTEEGFLTNFTDKELSAILTTSVKTNDTITEDKVFLLSTDELDLLVEADVRKFAYPTDEAKLQDQSGWYQLYVNDFGTLDHFWWLRDANTDNSCEVNVAANSIWTSEIISDSAGLEGYGVRPVMTIDLTSPTIEIN